MGQSPKTISSGEQIPIQVPRKSNSENNERVTTLVLRQTGPRTPAGKQRSKYNATKHGIFSSVVVLEGESRKDYESLLDGLCNSFRPVGELEEILVEKLSMVMWRHRRLILAEGAEIRRGRDFLEWDQECQRRVKAEKQAQQKAEIDSSIPDVRAQEGLVWHIENPRVLDQCLELLAELREDIETEGLPSESRAPTAVLEKIYGPGYRDHLGKTLFDIYVTWSNTAEASEEERQQEGCASPEQCKRNVLRAIVAEIERLERYKKEQLAVEARRMNVEKLRQGVPDSPGLDRLLRYEASLERAFDRTLTQLERLQRMRFGQPVPPPVKLELSKN